MSVTASEILNEWFLHPLLIAGLALSATLYIRGLKRIWGNAAPGRVIRIWEAACFAAGWMILATALVSPLHPLGERLFFAHMIQHELLMLVAAPLIVLGKPLLPFLAAFSLPWRRRLGAVSGAKPVNKVWGFVSSPLVAWGIHAGVLWLWHIPLFFEAALHSDAIHIIQHLTFFVSALLLWWALIHGQYKMAYGASVLYLFTTSLHSGLLGVLLTFGRSLWYSSYEATTPSLGLSPTEDQQLAGLIMWVPAGVCYLIAALALFTGWMRESERSALRKTTYQQLLRTKGG